MLNYIIKIAVIIYQASYMKKFNILVLVIMENVKKTKKIAKIVF